MPPRLWLLVGSDQETDRQTMSLIELSWTAKKTIRLIWTSAVYQRSTSYFNFFHFMPAVDATWASWGSWNSCSQTCGGGVRACLLWHFVEMTCTLFSKLIVIQTQSRSRDCNEAKYGGNTATCTSAEGDTQPCNTDICRKFVLSFVLKYATKWNLRSAVDASWAEWGSWGSCSKTCGGGVRLVN